MTYVKNVLIVQIAPIQLAPPIFKVLVQKLKMLVTFWVRCFQYYFLSPPFAFVLVLSETHEKSLCHQEAEDVSLQSNVGDNTASFIQLKKNLKEIKVTCGNVCKTNDVGVPAKYYNAIWKDFKCQDLFSNDVFDRWVHLQSQSW